MINLLPPTLKEQVRYAKYNQLALRYLRILALVVVVLGGVFAGAFYLLQQQASVVAKDVADKQASIASLTKGFMPQAKAAADRLNAITYVQATQTRFSAVVADFAKVLPQGVTIDTMTLTGDDKAPMAMAVTAQTYAEALAFRNALTTSPRVAGADLESIAQTTGPNGSVVFQANLVVGFKPGEAK